MIEIKEFKKEDIQKAKELALNNYEEERMHNLTLPANPTLPDEYDYFAKNGLGVTAWQENKMVGFMCYYKPWNPSCYNNSAGTHIGLHAHGAVKENRKNIYQRMYETCAEKWVSQGIRNHTIVLYEHDEDAKMGFFEYGFAKRCMDLIRPMESITSIKRRDITYRELEHDNFNQLRELRTILSDHLAQSPTFLRNSSMMYDEWINDCENGDCRSFVAEKDGKIIAYLDIEEDGENFICDDDKMMNIQGACCEKEYRGSGIYQELLEYVIETLKKEGNTLLGVDHESLNPTALHFWGKYFKPYTCTVIRKIDDCMFEDITWED